MAVLGNSSLEQTQGFGQSLGLEEPDSVSQSLRVQSIPAWIDGMTMMEEELSVGCIQGVGLE